MAFGTTSTAKALHEFFHEELYAAKMVSEVLGSQSGYTFMIVNIAKHISDLQRSGSKQDRRKVACLRYLVVDLINNREDKNTIISRFINNNKEVLNKRSFIINCVRPCFFCYCDCDSSTVKFLKNQIVSEGTSLIINQPLVEMLFQGGSESEEDSYNDSESDVSTEEYELSSSESSDESDEDNSEVEESEKATIKHYADRFVSLFNDRKEEQDVQDSDGLQRYFDNIILQLNRFCGHAECLTDWFVDLDSDKYFPKKSSASIKIREIFDKELREPYENAKNAHQIQQDNEEEMRSKIQQLFNQESQGL